MKGLKQNIIPICLILLLCSSIAMGILGYKTFGKIDTAQKEKDAALSAFDDLPWILPPTEDYAYLRPSEDENTIEGASSDYDTDYILSADGDIISKTPYEPIYLGEDLYLYKEDNKRLQGAADKDGNLVIPADFHSIETFCDGYAAAEDMWGAKIIIDKKGNIVYKAPSMTNLLHLSDTRYFVASQSSTAGENDQNSLLIDVKTGEEVTLSPKVSYLSIIDEGYIATINHDYYAFMDESFNFAAEGQLYNKIGSLSEEMRYADLRVNAFVDNGYGGKNSKSKKGYMDKQGKWVINLPENVLYGFPFSEGKAIVYTTEGIMAMDTRGSVLFEIPAKPDDSPEKVGGVTFQMPFDTLLSQAVFHHGFAPVMMKKNQYGIINTKGEFITAPIFDSVIIGERGICTVELDGRWGILDLKGGF